MSTTPNIKKSSRISAIWILPFIAICLCSWLVYDHYTNSDIEISLYFDDANGIIADKTHIITRGVQVGTVTNVEPDFEQGKVLVTAQIHRNLGGILLSDTLFWIVRPELSFSKITGLETIFGGNYIALQMGTKGKITSTFTGLETAPPIAKDTPGLHLTLKPHNLGSIQKGTGIYYRNIQIGSVQDYSLNGETDILVSVFIKPQYKHLIHTGSRFSEVSGMTIAGKLPDVKVQVESLSSLLKGGLLVHTPSQLANTPNAKNGDKFIVYSDIDAAEYGIEMTLKLPSLYNVTEGVTKVIYHGVEVGLVKRINLDTDDKVIAATILLNPRAEKILREGTTFWLVEPEFSLEGVKNLDTLLSGSYISFKMADQNAPFQDVFEISPEAPPIEPLRKGKPFTLTSRFISFSEGAPVFFKNIKVGEIVSSKLVESGRRIDTTIYIYNENLHLLSDKSVFWQYSGVQFAANLSGIELNVGPLSKVVSGAIAFTTPDKLNKTKAMAPKPLQVFKLFKNHQEAVKSTKALQQPGKTFRLRLTKENTLNIGSPILQANITIGHITGFDFDEDTSDVYATCFVQKKYQHLVTNRTRFYDASGVQISGGLGGINLQTGSLQSIINGGIGCFTPKEGHQKVQNDAYKLYPSFQDALTSKTNIKVFFSDLNGLQVSAPVLYKGIKIGIVEKILLGDDLQSVSAILTVEDRVLPLFRKNTKIWLETPNVSLQKVENLGAIILGPSISILPGEGPLSTTFKAQKEKPNLSVETGFPIRLQASRLNSLTIGSPIYYRQIQVGQVTGYKLAPDQDSVEINLNIEKEYRNLINLGTKFWSSTGISVDAGLFSGVSVRTESLESIMIGGISFGNPEKKEKRIPAAANTRFCLYGEPKDSWLPENY